METSSNLLETIGGQPAVALLVDELYRRIKADPMLSHYFMGISIQRLNGHQSAYLAQALGGPARYTGRSMRDAHANFHITDAAFDGVLTHLTDSLRAMGVDSEVIERIAATVSNLRAEIVNVEPQPSVPVG